MTSKIVELEEELRVVGNNLKSLEVSEEKYGSQDVSSKKQLNRRFIKIMPTIPVQFVFRSLIHVQLPSSSVAGLFSYSEL
ncbi:Tropomyosin [Amphibalanus amphitrite]|uniref:Tropomyosin n=1 Tax=Amphibalanus amphitrite TaxID=1232801 RepID=A0A6A4VP34_AMPAM|nr:Tropomyosin [Amphibalanus amphitrite]